MSELFGSPFVIQINRDEVRSAWPDAPVVAARQRHHWPRVLRRLFDQFDPSGRRERSGTA